MAHDEHERLGVNSPRRVSEGEDRVMNTIGHTLTQTPNIIADDVVDSAIRKLQLRINAIRDLRNSMPAVLTYEQANAIRIVVEDMTRLL